MTEPKPKFGIALFAIFALLIVSIMVALYLGATEEKPKSQPLEGQVTTSELRDYLSKLNRLVGKRNLETPEGRKALKQSASMIEGTLGPMNMGFEVSRSVETRAEGLLWKTLWVDMGEIEKKKVVLITVPYGEGGTPVAFSLGLAEYLVTAGSENHLRLVFYPPVIGNDLWEVVRQDGEIFGGRIDLLGGGPFAKWGLVSGEVHVQELLARPAWAENIEVVPPVGQNAVVRLSEKGPMKESQQAERLLRMMPVVKALADRIR
ncbi:MAG: hypothetical protein ACSHYF_02125 [Verrucomicrobiaceae bacterium]